MIDISILDFVLLNITSFLLGVASGLTICCQYKDKIMRSKSFENLRQYNHQTITQPPIDVIATSAGPPPPASAPPIKLTIQSD